MRRSMLLIAASMLAALTANAQYSRAPRSVLQSTTPAAPAPPPAVPGTAVAPPTMQAAPAPMPVTMPPPAAAAAPAVAPVSMAPAAVAPSSVAPTSVTPVTAAGGTLPGSATPGGVPVAAPGTLVDRAVANSVAPGSTTPPKFDRTNFDVDFGDVGSGGQVRRTIVLNTTTRGEAEFGLYVPNAPGFTITEVRVMGAGASVGAPSATAAPMPGGAGGGPQTMAVRTVAQRVTAPPWRAQFDAAAEVQVDVAYAPTLDMFSNTAGPKMGVLNGAIRNAGGAGTSASIALRANFTGAQLQPIVTVERELVAIFGESRVPLTVKVTSTGQSGPARISLVHSIPGLAAPPPIDATLSPGQSVQMTFQLTLAWRPEYAYSPSDAPNVLDPQQPTAKGRHISVEVAGQGFKSNALVEFVVLDALVNAPSVTCGAAEIPADFTFAATIRYSAADGVAGCSGKAFLTPSNDPFRAGGTFDWELWFGRYRLARRPGWNFPGGTLEQNAGQIFDRVSCGSDIPRDEYIRMALLRDSWRLACSQRR